MSAKSKGHRGGRGIVLDVTAEIITNAVQRDSSHCAIADALKAAVPTARSVAVDLQTIRFTDPDSGRRYIYLTPEWAQNFLLDFDQGKDLDPTSRRLGAPAQITRSESKRVRPQHHKARDLPDSGKQVVADGNHSVVLGGRPPATGVLSNSRGRRRSYGIRIASR